jgi:Ca2+ transporting ATPase
MEEAHLLPAADVLRRFSVTAEDGLSPAQVTGARERYGPNGERAAQGTGGHARRPP